MAESRVRPPIPPGENRITTLTERAVPAGYTDIAYVVHPSASKGGDYRTVVKDAVQRHVDMIPPTSRLVFIAPPEQSTYLAQGTSVNDIRSNTHFSSWVRDGDLSPAVQTITLLGGNLERCLGAVYQEAVTNIDYQTGIAEAGGGHLTVNLPLDAIYTSNGMTAQEMLARLLQRAEPLEAIVALLTTPEPFAHYDGYDYGEFGIISFKDQEYRTGARKPFSVQFLPTDYSILLNGQPIGKLQQPEEQPPEPPHEEDKDAEDLHSSNTGVMWEKIEFIEPPAREAPKIILQITSATDFQGLEPLDEYREIEFDGRIRYAREVVLPKYVATH